MFTIEYLHDLAEQVLSRLLRRDHRISGQARSQQLQPVRGEFFRHRRRHSRLVRAFLDPEHAHFFNHDGGKLVVIPLAASREQVQLRFLDRAPGDGAAVPEDRDNSHDLPGGAEVLQLR